MLESVVPDTTNEGEPTRDFYPTLPNRIVSITSGLALAAFGTLMAWAVLGRGEFIGIAFLIIAVVGVVQGVQWLRRLWSGTPSLSITDEGIIDRTALGQAVCIPWQEIYSVTRDDSSVHVRLQPTSRVRIPLSRRVFGWMFSKGALVIPTRFLDTTSDIVQASICDPIEAMEIASIRKAKSELPSGKQ